ncbi:MAG: AI-2E family transporter [Candidatus Contendobacter sp.]|jgi:predicted PurR-regulated permease PerM|nr:AI-2E family transporter [Gammaproteobacteria bacterium]MCC8994888.1 AI-2E family transporter [Candidatus Contendobacter sp.]
MSDPPVSPNPLSEPVRTALRLLLVGVLLIAVLQLLRPFLASMLWSAFIVITAWPGLAWLQQRWRWTRTACALLLVVALGGFVIGPLLAGVSTLAAHGDNLFQDARAAIERIPAEPPAWLENLPLIGTSLTETWRDAVSDGDSFRARLGPAIQAGGRWLLYQAGAIGELFLQFLMVIVFSLVFYLNGEAINDLIRRLADRIGGERVLEARAQAQQAIRAVALGVVLTALLQAGLALAGLLIAKVPLATLLTFVCFLLAIAQVGAAFPILGAAVWLYWQDQTGWAIFLAIWGLLVVGGVDNIVRPMLITRGMSMPLVVVFAGVIGGLLAYGLIGVFLGPTLMAIAYTLLLTWLKEVEPVDPPVAGSG